MNHFWASRTAPLDATQGATSQPPADRFDQLYPLSEDERTAGSVPWNGSVASRWTLVASFERDGERYVVAREILPSRRGPGALTDRERVVLACVARGCSTKEAAYELGISDSTVRVMLMRAARRCGAKDRHHLLELWLQYEPPSP